ncbi:hypothetical protein B0J13DRAFT_453587 [Dactylonectria estremocensis]|uniref:Uncharacterized protein n=1 Tax=Dactylonectria estremocensis TaxID=1079267 RepID=A0A9P9IQH5_9HYPO|nr:hypothetical protein B0J13DRAFT_453587 [Dactylonectria estremocensis]
MTRAGEPTATLQAGISLVTTEPAPMVQPSPMVTPGRMTTAPPIQQSSPIVTGFPNSMFSLRLATSTSWVAVVIMTLGPNMTRSPMVTSATSRMVSWKLL